VDEEVTTTANQLPLEEYGILRWGNRIRLQNLSSLFSIKEDVITCLIKQSHSAQCKFHIKDQRDILMDTGRFLIIQSMAIRYISKNQIMFLRKSDRDGDLRNFLTVHNATFSTDYHQRNSGINSDRHSSIFV
jgi:hypothetical protein